jgi:hypothetical protein
MLSLESVPLARALVIVLALAHAVGLADLLVRDSCEEICREDGCETDCVPGQEHACRCHCPSTMPLLGGKAQAIAKVDTPILLAPGEHLRRLHANPDPREILHVPKLDA